MALLPVAWSVILLFLLTLVVVAGVFLATAQYTRKETARGLLRYEAGEARVIATRGGMLQSLVVAEGDVVRAGQPLGFVSTRLALEGGGLAHDQILEGLRQEEDSLRARLAASNDAGPLQQQELRATGEAARAELSAAEASIVALEKRVGLARERLAAGEAIVAKGLIPVEEVRRRQETVIALEQAIEDARAKVGALKARVTELNLRLQRQGLATLESRAALEAQLAALSQRRVDAESARGYELRAPMDGYVSALQVHAGAALDAQRPVMSISPGDGVLLAEVYVPSRAIGFIAPGQAVRLLYDAFPYQRFGPGQGVVTEVSRTVLAPGDVHAAIRLEEPTYRVLVRLDRQSVKAFGRELPLSSGMALTADIVLEERSFAEWLLEPILAMRGRL